MPYVRVEVDKRRKGDQVKNIFIKVRVSEKVHYVERPRPARQRRGLLLLCSSFA